MKIHQTGRRSRKIRCQIATDNLFILTQHSRPFFFINKKGPERTYLSSSVINTVQKFYGFQTPSHSSRLPQQEMGKNSPTTMQYNYWEEKSLFGEDAVENVDKSQKCCPVRHYPLGLVSGMSASRASPFWCPRAFSRARAWAPQVNARISSRASVCRPVGNPNFLTFKCSTQRPSARRRKNRR